MLGAVDERSALAAILCRSGWFRTAAAYRVRTARRVGTPSPALADLDGDDQTGVIWGSCEVVALNDANVKLKWLGPGGNCVWAGVVTGLGRSPACADWYVGS